MTKTYYVGLDVHKETIAIAYATGGTRAPSITAPAAVASSPPDPPRTPLD